jgi:hypothetical protein
MASNVPRGAVRVLLALLLAAGAAGALARNDKIFLPIEPAMRSNGTRQLVSPDIALRFGSATAAGADASMGTVEVRGVGDPYAGSNPNNNGGGARQRHGDDATCLDAFRKAVVELQQRARSAGAVAVVGIVSNYEHVEMDSPTAYECHAGMTRAVVELKGRLSRMAQPVAAPAMAPQAQGIPADAMQPRPIASGFAAIDDVDAIPYLGDHGREDYRKWLAMATPKAFAIASNGFYYYAYGVKTRDPSDPTDPVARALAHCEQAAKQPCKLYAVNGSVVWTK